MFGSGKLEQQKHIEKITSRQDLVDVLQYIWRKFEVILNRKRLAQTIYDYIINILARMIYVKKGN